MQGLLVDGETEMTSRRQFFGILGAALAGATLDPEQLLWRPGTKTIFLPAARVVRDPATGMAVRFVREWDAIACQMIDRFDVLAATPYGVEFDACPSADAAFDVLTAEATRRGHVLGPMPDVSFESGPVVRL